MRHLVTVSVVRTWSLTHVHSPEASTEPWPFICEQQDNTREPRGAPESPRVLYEQLCNNLSPCQTGRRGHFNRPFLQPWEVDRSLALQSCKSLTKHILRESLQLSLCHPSKSQNNISPERHLFGGDIPKYLPTDAREAEDAP